MINNEQPKQVYITGGDAVALSVERATPGEEVVG